MEEEHKKVEGRDRKMVGGVKKDRERIGAG